MVRILLIAFIAIFISSDTLIAQQQSRRGRFFQNLFGGGQKAPTPNEALQQQQRLQQQKQAQQQKLSKGRTPTPLRSTSPSSSAARTPTPINGSSASRSKYQSPKPSTLKSPSATIYNQKKSASYRSKSNSRNGFGFGITGNDNDQLIVSSVDRSGNAAEAGLVRGDQVTEIGGIEASSAEEFDEIVKIMGQGDQMDFKVRRGGRERKLTIQFGNMPEPPEGVESSTAQSALSSSSSSNSRRYDFAPPNASNRSSATRQVSATTTRQIQQLNQTIVNQHRQIQQMQKEIEQLRQGFRSRQ